MNKNNSNDLANFESAITELNSPIENGGSVFLRDFLKQQYWMLTLSINKSELVISGIQGLE